MKNLFQRRHYELMARLVGYSDGDWVQLVAHITRTFAKDNPKFNLDKFMQACSKSHQEWFAEKERRQHEQTEHNTSNPV